MTLKKYLNKHKIQATPDQRSIIGLQIGKLQHKHDYILEDGFNVKFYDEYFLDDLEVGEIIVNELLK